MKKYGTSWLSFWSSSGSENQVPLHVLSEGIEEGSIKGQAIRTKLSPHELVINVNKTKEHDEVETFVIVIHTAGLLWTLDGHMLAIKCCKHGESYGVMQSCSQCPSTSWGSLVSQTLCPGTHRRLWWTLLLGCGRWYCADLECEAEAPVALPGGIVAKYYTKHQSWCECLLKVFVFFCRHRVSWMRIL